MNAVLEQIPIVGPVLSLIFGYPVKQLLSLPAPEVVETVRAGCTWLIGGGCS